MKFDELLKQVTSLGYILWGRVNENCTDKCQALFLQLNSTANGYEVDDWRLGRLRDNTALGWKVKNNKVLCNSSDICLLQEIEIGGTDGGNCWGGEAEYYSNSNALQKPFSELETILLSFFPDLLYSEYVQLKKSGVIEEIEHTETEYYGNSKNLVYRVVSLKKLYDSLQKK